MKYIQTIILLLLVPTLIFGQKNISAEWKNFYDSEILLFSTIKIEVYVQNKDNKAKIDTVSGTGFVFSVEIDSVKTLPIIVTK